ncbi:PUA domain containing protein [Candidatus Vecturithrix granuli]|uniref:PUA domain containing protein n=1 Tax=Vecturithrix granuli TaxID=1499967 RepID=A0A081C233_VECG1|nr:PUA domain containing protein [Candidatus Vecturithrix granuli]
MAIIILKPQREKSLLRRHPWVFTGAVAQVEGSPQIGETVEVISSQRELLGRGAYSPHSQIVVRMWSFDPDEEISSTFFRTRLQRGIAGRQALIASEQLTACRLINAESDGLPGLIVDRYDAFLVCQFLAAGAEYWKQEIVSQLQDLFPCTGIYERSDVDVRAKEGLPLCTGVLAGETPPEVVQIQEGALRFLVEIQQGHKTGFYLDQRENRQYLAQYVQHKDVLNCFAYTGGFGIYALKYGAKSVVNIDTSAAALQLLQRQIALNDLDDTRSEQIEGDVFQRLRQFRDARRQFDVIILDPPKFAESRSQLKSASRGYKDINLLAMKLLRPGGILFTFSCSGLMEPDLFQKIVADAALDARRDTQILHQLSQSADHPVALNFPEGHYLKGLVCKVW